MNSGCYHADSSPNAEELLGNAEGHASVLLVPSLNSGDLAHLLQALMGSEPEWPPRAAMQDAPCGPPGVSEPSAGPATPC